MDRSRPLCHHAGGPTRDAATLAAALPGDLLALRWRTDGPETVLVEGLPWPCWPIGLTWRGGEEVVELLLRVSHTVDRWRQSRHQCQGRLRLREGPTVFVFSTWGDPYGVIGATADAPPPALAVVMTGILARPVDAITAVWDGLSDQPAFAWMQPILASGVLQVDGMALDGVMDL